MRKLKIVSIIMIVMGLSIIFANLLYTNTIIGKIIGLILSGFWIVGGIIIGEEEKGSDINEKKRRDRSGN